jgi:hypothetical protein
MRYFAAVAALALITACGADVPPTPAADAGTELASLPAQAAVVADSAAPVITVYKSPTCGCCKGWVEHVKAAGYKVDVHDVADVTPVKDDAGVPADARSCHTAIVGGYALEGHVPASDIARLLKERPAIAGLTVPGMPVGSPGMEVPGQPADKYDVMAFKAGGSTEVYASH